MEEFHARNLSVIGYANGFTLWHYKHHGTVFGLPLDFFTAGCEVFHTGDIVMVVGMPTARDPMASAAQFVLTIMDGGDVAAVPVLRG